MKNEPVKSTFSPHDNYERMWYSKFNELCYEVFYQFPQGRELLAHMENRYFRSPVAAPNKEPSWAYFNEGRNEHIRSYTAAIQTYITTQQVKENKKPLPRRAKVKPIPNEG